MSSTKLQQTNPKCQVKSEIFDHQKDPSVEVTFSKCSTVLREEEITTIDFEGDGTKAKYNCLDMTALKIIEQINIKSRSVQ